jgi:phosphoserine phosphatase
MTVETEVNEQFTGLILLTGVDKAGISAALFQTLSPFAISIVDVEQLVISDRLILTVLIALNPSHQKAIEADLEECAAANVVDIATLFASRQITSVKDLLVDVTITSQKLQPSTVAIVSNCAKELKGNIESIQRINSDPISLSITISNSSVAALSTSLNAVTFEDGATVTVKAHA